MWLITDMNIAVFFLPDKNFEDLACISDCRTHAVLSQPDKKQMT